jgi:hypothetical protein
MINGLVGRGGEVNRKGKDRLKTLNAVVTLLCKWPEMGGVYLVVGGLEDCIKPASNCQREVYL